MSDYAELKAIALDATLGKWTTDGDVAVVAAESDQLNNGYPISECRGPEAVQNVDFIAAANPVTVLILIAENERLKNDLEVGFTKIVDERNKLKAENEALRQFILGFAEHDAEMAHAYAAMSKAEQ